MTAITQIKPEAKTASTSSIPVQNRFVRKKEVMLICGLPSSTIYDLMNRGLFPKSIKLPGGKAVAWLLSDVESWMQKCLADARGTSHV